MINGDQQGGEVQCLWEMYVGLHDQDPRRLLAAVGGGLGLRAAARPAAAAGLSEAATGSKSCQLPPTWFAEAQGKTIQLDI